MNIKLASQVREIYLEIKTKMDQEREGLSKRMPEIHLHRASAKKVQVGKGACQDKVLQL